MALTFAPVVMLLVIPVSSLAQQGVPLRVPSDARADSEAARIRDEQRREMQLRSTGTGAARADERSVKAAAEQLNQDFKRIQVIRNDIAHALKVEGVLDYRRVSGQAAEVRKRALRMQAYLALRGPDADEKTGAGQAGYDEKELKGALVRLCKRIDSFVANPRFTSPDVVDVDGTAKASRDLREIIALSVAVRNSAERLDQKHE
ncbi:MAG: hypothetical protein DMF67_07695 [Acidobacteria bacterium]|nr:MAG: hypothetical protein DMF66_03815 [Acidobacteriota bacterium]PYS83798.1 MAG: hypothetical protein DMF67_07695 [Acidobacteriota bacterium]